MKKIFVMFLAALVFVAPAAADDNDIEFTMDTPVLLSYDNFKSTDLFSSDEDGLRCFMRYISSLDNDYYDETKNGLRVSVRQLFYVFWEFFVAVSDNKIPDEKMNAEGVSCSGVRDTLKSMPDENSIANLDYALVVDTFANVVGPQKVVDAAHMDDGSDEIYNITVSYRGGINRKNAVREMYDSIKRYIRKKYCVNDAALISCAPTPSLRCDPVPNTTYLQRDLDLLCDERNWQFDPVGDDLYEIRLKRQ